MTGRTYDDEQLALAVTGARSWRGVIRNLGLKGHSSATYRSIQAHVARLGLDTTHFTGGRRWTEQELMSAVTEATSWRDVLDALGISGGSSIAFLKGHAARLGLDTGHFGASVLPPADLPSTLPMLSNLPKAGSMLAASWFMMCGYQVSWPLEPCRYDLLVARDNKPLRVQVKTCWRPRSHGWLVALTTSGHPTGGQHTRTPYAPDEIDYFFVIDGDLNYYLLPIKAVGGRATITLSAYQAFRVGRSLLELPLKPQPT